MAEDYGAVLGFATWERRTDSTAGVTWMAVHRERRDAGVGIAIIEMVCAQLAAYGYRLAFAMTAAATQKVPSDGPDVYEATRASGSPAASNR